MTEHLKLMPLCECCGETPATEVVYNVVSLCAECAEIVKNYMVKWRQRYGD